MTTSTEKLAALRPQVTQELEQLLVGNQQVGFLLRPVLASVRPILDAKVNAWLASDPADVDTVLGDLAGMLLALRSDDAPAIDLEAARQRVDPAGLIGPGPEPVPFLQQPNGIAPDLPGLPIAAELEQLTPAELEQLEQLLQLGPGELEQLAQLVLELEQLAQLEQLPQELEQPAT